MSLAFSYLASTINLDVPALYQTSIPELGKTMPALRFPPLLQFLLTGSDIIIWERCPYQLLFRYVLMGTGECYICSHMAIWERCSHMTLSERPILYNYASRPEDIFPNGRKKNLPTVRSNRLRPLPPPPLILNGLWPQQVRLCWHIMYNSAAIPEVSRPAHH